METKSIVFNNKRCVRYSHNLKYTAESSLCIIKILPVLFCCCSKWICYRKL